MAIQVKPIIDVQTWETFVATHPDGNFLQSWHWGEFHRSLGHTVSRDGFYKNDALMGTIQTIVENAKRGRYITVAAGPLIDWKNRDLVNSAFLHMKNIARHHSAIFVRIRPQCVDSQVIRQLFSSYGCVNAPMHLHAELTNQLDITKSEEELLAGMRKSTRYEIKQAQKQGIRITQSVNPEDILSFYNLQLKTAKRQGFVPFSLQFLKNQFAVFAKQNQALLYCAYQQKTLLAQAFIIFYGKEAAYHYGASTEEGRKFPGAYLIQWEAIKEAKRRGLKRYNFWGVAPEDQKGHRFASLSTFKRGFGGVDVSYLHAQDVIIQYPHYALIYIVERIRKIMRRV